MLCDILRCFLANDFYQQVCIIRFAYRMLANTFKYLLKYIKCVNIHNNKTTLIIDLKKANPRSLLW